MSSQARRSIASLALGVSLVLAHASHAQTPYTAVDMGGLPGPGTNQAVDVNDRGEVAGVSGLSATATVWTRAGIVEIGTLAPFGTDSLALGINKRGDVVGHSAFWTDTSVVRHGFLWRDGVLIDLGTLPGEDYSYAASINDRGEIAGISFTHFGASHVVLWRDGVIHDLGVLPVGDALVTDVNNRRQIVGYATSPTGVAAFTWTDGIFTYLPELANASYTFAWSINDRGEIAGSSIGADGSLHAVVWRDGAIVDLGRLPGSLNTEAYGINDRGQVVGFATMPDATNRAFLWEGGTMRDLGTLPGGNYAIARAINNHGDVVGFGLNAEGLGLRAIMWIPQKGR
jgi:probable HAF family extracellular repeat protein